MSALAVFEEFSGRLAAFADAVSRGKFALWVGSGVSRDRVAPVRVLIRGVLEHLRARAVAADDSRFEVALKKILTFVELSTADKSTVDFAVPVEQWPAIELILSQLEGKYSKVFDVVVDGEDDDYLLWEAVDVRGTYADPDLVPHVDHLAIAMLILEGVVERVVTANWDPLLERAIASLTQAPVGDIASVIVRGEDLRDDPALVEIYKIHGCATMAATDPSTYRSLLVVSDSQIAGWAGNKANAPILARLIEIASRRKSLLLGLSGQDANIKHVFSEAEGLMPWKWPDDPSACMCSTPHLEDDHKSILKNVYRQPYADGEGANIEAASVVGWFPREALVALVIYVVFAKLAVLMRDAMAHAFHEIERESLVSALMFMSLRSAQSIVSNDIGSVTAAIGMNSHVVGLFVEGEVQVGKICYRPLATAPVHQVLRDAFIRGKAFSGMAVALALLGFGWKSGLWTVTGPDLAAPTSGSFSVTTPAGAVRVFIVSGADASLRLYGRVKEDDEDAVILYADRLPPAVVRSPTSSYGRTGKASLRSASIADLIARETTAAGLFQSFRASVVI